MAEVLKLSVHDHALIHTLALMSRPPLVGRGNLPMVADILRTEVLPGVNRTSARLLPLIQTAEQIASFRPVSPGYFGGLHDRAWKQLNEWDSRRLSDALDSIRGVR